MKKIFLIVAFITTITSQHSFAQDSTGVGTGGNSGVFFSENMVMWLTVTITVYELIVRLFPTVKNISLLSFVMNILTRCVPNKSPQGKKDYL